MASQAAPITLHETRLSYLGNAERRSIARQSAPKEVLILRKTNILIVRHATLSSLATIIITARPIATLLGAALIRRRGSREMFRLMSRAYLLLQASRGTNLG